MQRRGFIAALLSLPVLRWLKPTRPLDIKVVDIPGPSRKLSPVVTGVDYGYTPGQTWVTIKGTDLKGNPIMEHFQLPPEGMKTISEHAYKNYEISVVGSFPQENADIEFGVGEA